MKSTLSAGVDAAHILPWAAFGINSVSNGVCLSKLCHWAFDAGILRFEYDSALEQYIVKIPSHVVAEAERSNFDLAYFRALEGPVDATNLPKDRKCWPDPELLKQLNAILVYAP